MVNNEEPFELLVVRPVTEMNTNGFAISPHAAISI